MTEQDAIKKGLVSILVEKFGFSQKIIDANFGTPLNGNIFHFDAIDMVYFVLELQKKFKLQLRHSELQRCFFWSAQNYLQCLLERQDD